MEYICAYSAAREGALLSWLGSLEESGRVYRRIRTLWVERGVERPDREALLLPYNRLPCLNFLHTDELLPLNRVTNSSLRRGFWCFAPKERTDPTLQRVF